MHSFGWYFGCSKAIQSIYQRTASTSLKYFLDLSI